ncbi:MAG: TIGR03790 family protein [Candidatus Didemnitutus sp.]|nr:TIGR03790 family protein [Candidatus Didemnitutus sp.]
MASDVGELAARTVILVNSRQSESVELGSFYAAQRAIPTANIIALPMPEAESVTWREFVDQVWQPLQNELVRRKWLDGFLAAELDEHGRRKSALTGHRIAYLVVCRGTPLRIHHDPTTVDEVAAANLPEQFRRNGAAVDSELSLLGQSPSATIGFLPNPLFNVRLVSPVSAEFVVKVARLDGPTLADAKSLVSSSLEAEQQGAIGRYYLDFGGPHATGDLWLETTRGQLTDLGYFGDVQRGPGTFDAADRFDAPVWYFGWYHSALNGPFLREGFRFAPGAIALHIHSFSAATLRSSSEGWCGPLVARGVAATFGNVFEPYLEFTLRPDLLLEQLARGATLGDAAYFATPVLSWQSVIIGDPLYRPFLVSLPEQLARLDRLPASLAGNVIARQVAVWERTGMANEARVLLAKGMREHPSLSLALVAARFELSQENPAGAAQALSFVPQLREISLADWPLVRTAAELISSHGSARDALVVFQNLVKAKAPTTDAYLQALTVARKLADATGNLPLSLEFARLATEAAIPVPPLPSGK